MSDRGIDREVDKRWMDGLTHDPSDHFPVPTYSREDRETSWHPDLPPVILPSKTATLRNRIINPKHEVLYHHSSRSHLNFFHPHQQPVALQALTNSVTFAGDKPGVLTAPSMIKGTLESCLTLLSPNRQEPSLPCSSASWKAEEHQGRLCPMRRTPLHVPRCR